VKEDRNVTSVFAQAASNYFRWGKGTNDVLQDATVLSAKKPKSRRKGKGKEKGEPDTPPPAKGGKKLFEEAAEEEGTPGKGTPGKDGSPRQALFTHSPKGPRTGPQFQKEGAGTLDMGSSPVEEEAAGDAVATLSSTPRRRRTGGRKSKAGQLQNLAKSAAAPQADCTVS